MSNVNAWIIRFLCRGSFRNFLKNAETPDLVNQNTLADIISRNAQTRIGKCFGFSGIKNHSQYRKAVPLARYDYFENYIQQMAEGEQDVLTVDPLHSFGLTSGTTARAKMIPITRKASALAGKRIAPLYLYTIATCFPDIVKARGGISLQLHSPGQLRNGVPVGPVTANSRNRMKGIAPFIYASPFEVSALKEYNHVLYLHLLFALKEKNLRFLSSTFASGILDFFFSLERNGPALLENLRQGKIPDYMVPEQKLKISLEKKLNLSRKRIREIELAFAPGTENIARRLWPRMGCISTTATGPFRVYAERFKKYTGSIPVYSPFYGATEGMFGINLNPAKNNYTLLTGTAFWEFLPQEEIEKENPETCLIEELVPGSSYEVINTNYSGLYRYRMGDIIKVVDFFNKLPVVEFVQRQGMLLSVAGEKTTEQAVIQALTEGLEEQGHPLLDFTTSPGQDSLPGCYQFFVEFKDPQPAPGEMENMARILDKVLTGTNPRYGAARIIGKLAPLKLFALKSGTFQEYKQEMIARGSSMNQIKIPHFIDTDDRLAFFQERVK